MDANDPMNRSDIGESQQQGFIGFRLSLAQTILSQTVLAGALLYLHGYTYHQAFWSRIGYGVELQAESTYRLLIFGIPPFLVTASTAAVGTCVTLGFISLIKRKRNLLAGLSLISLFVVAVLALRIESDAIQLVSAGVALISVPAITIAILANYGSRNAGVAAEGQRAGRGAGLVRAAGAVMVGLAVAVSVSMGLSYADFTGSKSAYEVTASKNRLPVITVYSETNLDLSTIGVNRTTSTDSTSRYKYKYEGYFLLKRINNGYLIVDKHWKECVVLKDEDSIRVEIERPPYRPPGWGILDHAGYN